MLDNLPAQVVARTHPFKSDRIVGMVSAGKTVTELLYEMQEKHGISAYYSQRIYVEIDGVPVHPDLYATAYVKGNSNIVIQYCVPQGGGGGGSNPLRMVLTIALVALAVALPGMLPAESFFAAGMGAGLLTGAVMMAGSMIINAICPPTSLSDKGMGHNSSAESDVYSITGMQNYAPHYKALPIVLGRVRFAPPYGALPYTHLEGNDQFLHTDVVWGKGELKIEDIRIGETSLSTYQNVTVATNLGKATDQELKLFPRDVFEDGVDAVVFKATPLIRTSQLETDYLQVDVVFSRGLTGINDQGNRISTSVTFHVHYKLKAASTWTLASTQVVTAATAQPLRKSIQINPPTVGQFDVRVTRVTADKLETDDKLYNEFSWSILRSLANRDPVQFDCPIAETQLIIKATDQLSGNISTLNGVVTSVCLDYNKATNTWVHRATRNPASLYRHVLQGGGCAKIIENRLLDIPALEEWHDFCVTNGFTYNYVQDAQKPTLQVLYDICHAGRATFVMLDSMRSVVIDRERTLGAVQMFTPSNSVNFSLQKTFAEEVHGYRINFNNEESDFAEDEIITYAQGYSATNANLFEALQFTGVTNPAQVQKLGRYHLATRIYRPEVFTWETDWEHVVASRGDLVRLSNPSILVAQASGMLKSVNRPTKTITLDQGVVMIAGNTYALSVRTMPKGTTPSVVYTLPVTADAVDSTVLHYTQTNPPIFTAGDMYTFGEMGLEAIDIIVTSKRPSSDMRATMTGIQYSWPQIKLFLAGAYPDHNTGVSLPVFEGPQKPPTPSFSAITGGKPAIKRLADGSVIGRVIALVSVPASQVGVSEVHVEIRVSGGSWERSPNLAPTDAFEFEGINDGTVELRARTMADNGMVSAWFYASYVQDAVYSAPPTIISMTATGDMFANHLSWVLPADFAATNRIEVWCSPESNNRGLAELIGTLGKSSKWTHQNLNPALVYYYWLRVRTAEDKFSEYLPTSTSGGKGASPSSDPDMLLRQLQGQRIDENLGIDGDLIVAGSITAREMAAHSLFTWSLKSQNYVPNQTGFILDATNGFAEFNNIDFNLNYLSQDDLDAGLDTTTGGLIVRDSASGDYAHLTAGDLNFYYKNDANFDLYKSVTRMEAGVVNNGTLVKLPGIFKQQPRVIIVGSTLQTYNAGSPAVNQQQVLAHNAITESPVGSGKWGFTPTATLQTATGTSNSAISSLSASCSSYTSIGQISDNSNTNNPKMWFWVNNAQGTLMTTPVTQSIRIVGSVSYSGAGYVELYTIVDGAYALVFATYTSGSGSIAVDVTRTVSNLSHSVGLSLKVSGLVAEGKAWTSSFVRTGTCSYTIERPTSGGPVYCTMNPYAVTNLTAISALASSSTLSTGSVAYFAIGQ